MLFYPSGSASSRHPDRGAYTRCGGQRIVFTLHAAGPNFIQHFAAKRESVSAASTLQAAGCSWYAMTAYGGGGRDAAAQARTGCAQVFHKATTGAGGARLVFIVRLASCSFVADLFYYS